MQYGLLKEDYFQWDTGQRVELYPDGDDEITELHMYNNRIGGLALVMEVKTDENGTLYADIPDLLFRLAGRIIFWRVVSNEDGTSTKEEYDGINVIPRAKPSDYVYTAPDVLNYKELLALYDTLTREYQELLQKIADGTLGGKCIHIGPDEPEDKSMLWIDTDETVGGFVISVNGQTGEITLTAEDVGADPAGSAATVQTNLDTHASNTSNPHAVTKTQVGLGNVDNVKQYSASNPPPYPVTSVNGQTGAAVLDADGVGARPSTWTPTASEVGADPAGTASSAVSTHNTATAAHSDIRLLIDGLTSRLNALADSDDTTLDQLSELVAYIKANRELIESVTTSKVNVSDIVNDLITNVSTKPLSAAQGVALKALIDAITVPTKLSELSGDSTHRTVTDAEKTAWNAKSDFSGSYDDLKDKPSIPDKANCVYYIVGTGTAAGTWIGEHSDIAEYYEGLMIAYKIGIAGLSTGTTLNINNLGAIPVVRNVSTAISTAYAVQSVINLTYTVDTSGTAYWKISDYDSNTRNTVGDYNLTDTKLYLIGSKTVDASSTSSYAQSYANDSCYIGADNHLYSGGEKVVTGDVVTSLNGATGAVELTSETWEFELEEDGSTVTKKVLLA